MFGWFWLVFVPGVWHSLSSREGRYRTASLHLKARASKKNFPRSSVPESEFKTVFLRDPTNAATFELEARSKN